MGVECGFRVGFIKRVFNYKLIVISNNDSMVVNTAGGGGGAVRPPKKFRGPRRNLCEVRTHGGFPLVWPECFAARRSKKSRYLSFFSEVRRFDTERISR